MTTLKGIYEIWLPVAFVIVSSITTALTNYPKADSAVKWLRVAMDFLSFFTHKNSPGTLSIPGMRSAPPASPGRSGSDIGGGGLLVLAILLLAKPAHADAPLAPMPATAVVMPAPTPAAPAVPTFGEVAACTIQSLPGTIGKCVADPGKVAPLDSRAFWMTFGTAAGSTALSVTLFLLEHYLAPEPMK